jgi:hypothetical protein
MRRLTRQIYFVGAATDAQGNLIIKMIPSISQQEAIDLFVKEFSLSPQEILGPFYKKRTQILETTRTLKFSSKIKKALFNGWIVNAFLLKEPIDQAYLVFIKRQDGKKAPSPKGTITVPISDLRFITDDD